MEDQEILAQLGFSVVVAGTGAEALAHLAANHCDVILIDSPLPDISSGSLGRVIQKTTKEPFILMIVEDEQQSSGAADQGMDGWIVRPLGFDRMMYAINLAEQNRRARIAPPVTLPSGIDQRVILELLEEYGWDNRIRAYELLQIFVRTSENLEEQMRSAIVSGVYSSLNLPLHSLKSNAKVIGAMRLSQLCKEWGARESETIPPDQRENLAQIILGELEIVVNTVRAMIEQ